MRSPLYATFKKRVNDAINLLIAEQVTPWAFLTAGPPFRIRRFDGREIVYEGIAFEGSPQEVFWGGYIEPFVENLVGVEIAEAARMAKEKGVDGKQLLSELRPLLRGGILRIYNRMADVDRRLRGKGYPNHVEARSVAVEVRAMNRFIDEVVDAEQAMWKPHRRFETWYNQNRALVWAIGLCAAVAIGVAGLFS